MHDHFSELYEWDGNVPRKKRMLPDGATFHFPYSADHAFGFRPHFSDGSPDFTNPNKPGHRFADVDNVAKIAADQSYEQRRTRMDYRQRQQDAASDHGSQQRTLSLHELEQAAAASYAARTERMKNAWRRP